MQLTLNLFPVSTQPDVPPLITEILKCPEAALVISVSGGKDSQALLFWIQHLRKLHGWAGTCYAIYADLGRIEWPQTHNFVRHIAEQTITPLVVVKRRQGDLIDMWQQRREKLIKEGDTKPFWSSAAARYCTKGAKVQPIDAVLRQHKLIVCALGLRAEESKSRARKPVFSMRQTICAKYLQDDEPDKAWSAWNKSGRKGRYALDWNSIHHWSVEKVWEWCGTTLSEWERRRLLPDDEALNGWTAHPAYVLGRGNERLSCAFCVLGSQNDLLNALAYNLETYSTLVDMEMESGWTFQPDRSLANLTGIQIPPQRRRYRSKDQELGESAGGHS